MAVPIFTHSAMLEHRPPSQHPERPERLTAVLGALEAAGLAADRRQAAPVDRADLLRVHPADFIEQIEDLSPATGTLLLDPDTAISPGSLAAAHLAAGAVTGA